MSAALGRVWLQLASAACYAPAMVSLLGAPAARRSDGLRLGATLLLAGAMGSAADAIFHLRAGSALLARALSPLYAPTPSTR